MLNILLALALVLADFTVAIDQPDPHHFGDTVTYSLTFPPEAARNSRHPQYANQPGVQTDCYEPGTANRIWTDNTSVDSQKRTKDGYYVGQSYPVSLGYTGVGWITGPADCYVSTFYFDVKNVYHYIAQSSFAVVG